MSVYLPRIKYAQATTTTPPDQLKREVWCLFFFEFFVFETKIFRFSSLVDFFSLDRHSSLSLCFTSKFFLLLLFHTPLFLGAKTTFCDSHFSRLVHFSLASCCSYPKKTPTQKEEERKNLFGFPFTQIRRKTHHTHIEEEE